MGVLKPAGGTAVTVVLVDDVTFAAVNCAVCVSIPPVNITEVGATEPALEFEFVSGTVADAPPLSCCTCTKLLLESSWAAFIVSVCVCPENIWKLLPIPFSPESTNPEGVTVIAAVPLV